MLLSEYNNGLGLEAKIIEAEVNHEASEYISTHYRELIKFIKSLSIKEEKANDLLHDVYISVVTAENEGNGFNMEYGSTVNDDGTINCRLIDIAQFVYGRIKLYAKNAKYRTDIVESGNNYVNETKVYYESVLDAKGKEILDKDGNIKTVKKVEKTKVPILVSMVAATPNEGGDIVDNNDDFQKAFYTASVSDSTDNVTDMLSMQEQIDFCVDLCNMHNVNIVNILKNIDILSDMLGDYSKKKRVPETVFKKITELATYHDEFRNALVDVIKYSATNKGDFERLMLAY